MDDDSSSSSAASSSVSSSSSQSDESASSSRSHASGPRFRSQEKGQGKGPEGISLSGASSKQRENKNPSGEGNQIPPSDKKGEDTKPRGQSHQSLSSTSQTAREDTKRSTASKKRKRPPSRASSVDSRSMAASEMDDDDRSSSSSSSARSDESSETAGANGKRMANGTRRDRYGYAPRSEIAPGQLEPFDWDALLATSASAATKLQSQFRPDEVSALVGLATTEIPGPIHSNHQSTQMGSSQLKSPTETNPLFGLPSSPPPLSLLNHIIRQSLEAKFFDDGLRMSFGDSALVALGMLVEESITASLMPLAALHVLRCRELEDKVVEAGPPASLTEDEVKGSDNIQSLVHPLSGSSILTTKLKQIPENNDPFEEWAGLPEEAVQKIYEDGRYPSRNFPTALPPTRTIHTENQEEETSDDSRNHFSALHGLEQLESRSIHSDIATLFLSGSQEDDGLYPADNPPIQESQTYGEEGSREKNSHHQLREAPTAENEVSGVSLPVNDPAFTYWDQLLAPLSNPTMNDISAPNASQNDVIYEV